MAMKLCTTAQAAEEGIKILVHAPSGFGKTVLCSTVDSMIIISKERGLLSLRGHNIPAIQVTTLDDVKEAYRFVRDHPEGRKFRWVAVDSISDIAETVLLSAKSGAADPRRAYGGMAEQMVQLITDFRDLPGRNVLMTCKQELSEGMYRPALPGKILTDGTYSVAYYFDEVFALHVIDVDGRQVRALQTGASKTHIAKDRSAVLEFWEPANLAHIEQKILSTVPRPM